MGEALPALHGSQIGWTWTSGPFDLSFPYSPTLNEILIMMGSISADALVWLLGIQLQPLKRKC